MSEKKPSYSQLTHDVVQQAPEPLTAAEILGRVAAIRPITTKNPKNTIRNVITQSRIIVATGNGRYGWKPRLIDGSVVRHTLSEAELVEKELHWDVDLKDALWPIINAPKQYADASPAKVALPNETVVELNLNFMGHGLWGCSMHFAVWLWLQSVEAEAGDHLIFRVIDSAERWYAVTFEARAERNEAMIQERNEAIIALGQKMMRRPYAAMDSEIVTAALATGLYQNDVPPDPFGELWADIRQALYEEPGDMLPEVEPDPLLSALFERPALVYDPDNPPSLPREYDPDYGRRHARQSLKARKGSVKSWTFRVNHRDFPDIWADIELAEDQTLEDLHLQIQVTFGWNDDHLYSFFIGDETGEKVSEVGSPWSDTLLHTHLVTIGELGLAPGRLLLYLFDYGDNHEFDVEVIDLNPLAPKGEYPKILHYPGVNRPQQYPE
ncbi:MAG: hypothetical protein H6667_25435 [Ardenticatenaceae bacterium]|nr:hypothetical protein [Ardenticatenaceae bacterium]